MHAAAFAALGLARLALSAAAGAAGAVRGDGPRARRRRLPRRQRDDPAQAGRARARRRGQRGGARDRRRQHAHVRRRRNDRRREHRRSGPDRGAGGRSLAPGPERARARRRGQRARRGVGAARGGRSEVSVCNRTPDAPGARRGAGRACRPGPGADILVNCTSVGLVVRQRDEQPQAAGFDLDQVGGYSYVVDLVYSDGPTPCCARPRAGRADVDGLDVLVAQGALSFELWTGSR